MRTIRLLTVLGFVLGALGAASPAAAQDASRVQLELDRTDARIQQAETIVSGSDNAEARADLDLAISVQAQARSQFSSGHPRIAYELTLRARNLADQAIALVKGLPDPDVIRTQVERTREILERARDRINECDNDRAHALFGVAITMQQRAEDALLGSRYLAALQLTMSARERALRALRLCRMEENLQDAAERALQRTDEILSRARDAVAAHSDERARTALTRASSLEDEARGQDRGGHYEACLRLTLSARAFAFRAIRFAGGRI
jgi:hypothetical protein